jgi:hypothetical protein
MDRDIGLRSDIHARTILTLTNLRKGMSSRPATEHSTCGILESHSRVDEQ